MIANISPAQLAKAFVSFNATKNVSGVSDLSVSTRQILKTYNVNNVLRNSIGNYSITFNTGTFINNSYLMLGTARFPNIVTYSNTATTEDTITVIVMDNDRNLVDTDLISLTFYNN